MPTLPRAVDREFPNRVARTSWVAALAVLCLLAVPGWHGAALGFGIGALAGIGAFEIFRITVDRMLRRDRRRSTALWALALAVKLPVLAVVLGAALLYLDLNLAALVAGLAFPHVVSVSKLASILLLERSDFSRIPRFEG